MGDHFSSCPVLVTYHRVTVRRRDVDTARRVVERSGTELHSSTSPRFRCQREAVHPSIHQFIRLSAHTATSSSFVGEHRPSLSLTLDTLSEQFVARINQQGQKHQGPAVRVSVD